MSTYPNSSFSKRRVLLVATLLFGASSTAAALDVDFGGRIQEHTSFFSGSGKKTGATNDFPNGAKLRRADLFAKGSLGRDDLSFAIQYKMNGNVTDTTSSHLQKAYLKWNCDNFHVNVGQQYMPFGMQHTASSSNLLFMERSAASDAAGLTRTWLGVNAGMMADMFTLNLSVATRGLEENNPLGIVNSDKYAYLVRATAVPMQGDEGTVHIGVDFKNRKFSTDDLAGVAQDTQGRIGTSMELQGRANNGDVVNLRQQAVGAGTGTLKSQSTYIVELAGAYNGVTLESEYFNTNYKFTGTSTSQKTKSWYVQAGYVLTGEQRTYSMASGVFKDPKPAGDNGAWEVALRYSAVDLTRTGNSLGGGKAKSWTAGVNWFVTDQVKFQANYNRAKFSFGPDATADRKIGAFGLGMQLLF